MTRFSLCLAFGLLTLSLLGALTGCRPAADSQTSDTRTNTPRKDVGFRPEGCIAPSVQSIQDGTYKPLSRPLFLYVNKAVLKKPEAVAFLRYYFSDISHELIPEAGFIPLPEQKFREESEKLEAAIKAAGTVVSGELYGQLIVDGSSTVAPVSTVMAEEFSLANPTVRVPVGSSGTGGGFKKFCHGEISICDASREIKESEIELCRKAGIDYLALEICLDGITIVVNPEADWIAGITIDELRRLWNPKSTIHKWSELRPEYPDAPIKLFGPDTDSGTFEYFTETVCGKKGASRSDYQQSGDDNFLVTGVSGDRYALGYFGYAYYTENQHKLKALSVAP